MNRENAMESGRKRAGKQKGFTLIEAMISIAVLSFGVLSLAAVYAQGIFYASLTQYDYIAEKKAEQAVESIFAARDTGTLKWSQIQNVLGSTGSDGGVFIDGAQPILVPGPDGLVGATTDTGAADEVIIVGPGPDRIFGTADDETVDLNPWMKRTIAITAVANEQNLRMITVTITYQVGRLARTHTLISYVSAFA
jgi:prepilin-type N-terminal cleavage/methylation domain-containing protein